MYYVGDVATPLEAEAALGNSLVWYLTPDGLPQTVAPTPLTIEPGITTYYVRQTNGICESEMASITVEVRDISDLITNPMIRQRVK